MNVNFVIYDPATGEIRGKGHCPEDQFQHQTWEGLEYLLDPGAAADPEMHFVQGGVLCPKQVMNPLIKDHLVKRLPIPCVVTINGQEYVVDDGELELHINLPGTYKVTLRSPGHFDYSFDYVK